MAAKKKGGAQPIQKGEAERTARRRKAVAELRLRGMTQEEIAANLPALGITHNDVALSPYTQQTISDDLAFIRASWMEAAADDLSVHRARQLAEIAEVKRLAWTKGNYGLVLKAIEDEIKLLGTAQPLKIEMTIELLEITYVLVAKLKENNFDPAEVFNDLFEEIVRHQQQGVGRPGGSEVIRATPSGGA